MHIIISIYEAKEIQGLTADVKLQKTEAENRIELKSKRAKTVDPEKMAKAKLKYLAMKKLHDDLSRANKKVYAITKTIERMEADLAAIPQSIRNRKERKALEARIETEKAKLAKAREHLQALPRMKGFGSVKDAEVAYRKAAGIYNTLLRQEGGMPIPKKDRETGKRPSADGEGEEADR